MYDTVAVATDGSQTAERAVDHAVSLAASEGATLRVISVVDTMAYGMADVRSDVVMDSLEEDARAAVDDALERAAAAGVEADGTVRFGSPAREIVEFGDGVDADVVVLGTHGRRGVERFLLGSVAERVVRTSSRPVLTIRPAEESGSEGAAGPASGQ